MRSPKREATQRSLALLRGLHGWTVESEGEPEGESGISEVESEAAVETDARRSAGSGKCVDPLGGG